MLTANEWLIQKIELQTKNEIKYRKLATNYGLALSLGSAGLKVKQLHGYSDGHIGSGGHC